MAAWQATNSGTVMTVDLCDVLPSLMMQRSNCRCGVEWPSLESHNCIYDSWLNNFTANGFVGFGHRSLAVYDNLDLRASCRISRGLREGEEDTFFGVECSSAPQCAVGTDLIHIQVPRTTRTRSSYENFRILCVRRLGNISTCWPCDLDPRF